MNYRISMIVLAAGLSSRFGRNKMLEPIGSTTLLKHVVSVALRSSITEVVVVGGHDFQKITSALGGYECKLVFNEEFRKGQSFSVRKGLGEIDRMAEAVMIQPGDMALTTEEIINAVVDEYTRTRAPIVSAGHNGRAGHPILFDRSLFEELQSIDEETRGLKKVVLKHLSEARIVETGVGALFDLDTPEDLSRFDTLRVEDVSK